MFVSGMGFFTDAYDLFVVGIVVALLKAQLRVPAGVPGGPGHRHRR